MTTIHSEYPVGVDSITLTLTVNNQGWYSSQGLFNENNQIIGNVWASAADTINPDPYALKEAIDSVG
jgi:hypothetical protein